MDEKILNKWIKDTKMEEIHKIHDELNEAKYFFSKSGKDNIEEMKEDLIKKGDECAKMHLLIKH